ncbi:hypothetical protein [Methylobacterium sp. WL120]|uniref:hypothetical protein n=1 Tax=Methylobacterium sp. WL120 TaxID=2603887 RepID=UPI0011C998B0|nr:hypothetical protein [Methylobacterium sp. WL120]TXM69610.1 hypothetical protein FV229_04510 [Methylobacterium sp. WL120]
MSTFSKVRIPTSPSEIKRLALNLPPTEIFISSEVYKHQAKPSLATFLTIVEIGKIYRFTREITITKEIADWLLANNESNRTKKNSIIKAIKESIASGLWGLNGETVIVSDDGKLNDGQNRLTAISESGKSVTANVAFGYKRETRMTVDSAQAARTSGDLIKMHDVNVPPNFKSVSSLILQYKAKDRFPSNNITPDREKVSDFTIKNVDALRFVMDQIDSTSAKLLMPPTVMGAIFYIIAEKSTQPEVEKFMKSLLTGEYLSSSDPIFILRARLMQENKKKRNEYNEYLELVVRAWNHKKLSTTAKRTAVTGVIPDLIP